MQCSSFLGLFFLFIRHAVTEWTVTSDRMQCTGINRIIHINNISRISRKEAWFLFPCGLQFCGYSMFYRLHYSFVSVFPQVLLGLDNAHHDDGESNHHSCGNNLLLRADYHHLAGLQRGFGHHLPGGLGHELQNGDRQWGELRDHPRSQSHQDELPEELVRRGLPFLHSSGLYIFDSGERLWLRGI